MPTANPLLRHRRLLLLMGLAMVSSIGASLLFYRHHVRYQHLAAHEEGVLFRSAWMEPEALQEVVREYGIRTVVHLGDSAENTGERSRNERAAVTAMHARWIELPLPKTMNAADPRIARHLEILGNPENFPMLVQSREGIDRTSMFLAIYDIAFRGMTARESLATQPRFGLHEHTAEVQLFVRNFEYQHRQGTPTNTAARAKTIH